MAPKLDPAILEALFLDAANTTLATHGSSGFASTAKIAGMVDGKEKLFFVKTGKGRESEVMFAGTSISSPSTRPPIPNSLSPSVEITYKGKVCKHVIVTDMKRGTYVFKRNP